MMWQDPIVEEIHAIRKHILTEHNNDIHELMDYYRKKQRESGRKIVSRIKQQTLETSSQTATNHP